MSTFPTPSRSEQGVGTYDNVSTTAVAPLVSVIIPCYNQGRFLPDSVGSLQAQTMTDWECIIVNDGSTDGTEYAARTLMRQDPRIRYVKKRNGGLSSARNAGLEACRGRYIQFLDADDAIAPNKLDVQLRALAESPDPAVACSDYYYGSQDDLSVRVDELYMSPRIDTRCPLEDVAARWATGLCIPCHSWLFDARLFKDRQIRFDTRLPAAEDWDCWMCVLASHPRVVFVDEPLAIYRYHAASMSRDRARNRAGILKAISKQIRLNRGDPELCAILREKLAGTKRMYRWNHPVLEGAKRLIPSGVRPLVKRLVGR